MYSYFIYIDYTCMTLNYSVPCRHHKMSITARYIPHLKANGMAGMEYVARISVCNHVMLHAVLTRMQFCIWPHTWNDILDRYLLVNYFTSLLLLIKKTSCRLIIYMHYSRYNLLQEMPVLEQIELRLLLLEFAVLTVESLLKTLPEMAQSCVCCIRVF